MDEFESLKAIDSALSELDEEALTRTLNWIAAKYGRARVGNDSTPTSLAPSVAASANASQQSHVNLSVRAIAQQLGAKSAGDVLQAAAASLTLVHSHEQFSWKDLLAEATKATGYWTKHHPSNAAQAGKRLRSEGILVELANGNFSLSPMARTTLATALGANQDG